MLTFHFSAPRTICVRRFPGGPALLEQLQKDAALTSNTNAKEGLADLAILFTLLKAYKVLDRVRV